MDWQAALNTLIGIAFSVTAIYFAGTSLISFEREEHAKAVAHAALWAITVALFVGWLTA